MNMRKNTKLESIARDLEHLTALLEVTHAAAGTCTGSSVSLVLLDACNTAHKLQQEVEELIDPT